MKSKTQNLFALLLAAAGLVSVACGHDAADHASIEAATISAELAAAQRIEISEPVALQGSVESDRAAAISARVMAMVTDVHVQAGDQVEKGDLLLEIDPQTSKGQVAQARGAQAQAQAALSLAERNYERFQALADRNAASELEVDMARMQYEQAKGAVEQASGAVQAASSVASDSRVTAPFPGTIVQRMVEVGDLAAPGRPLLMLQSEAARRLAVTVPESLLGSTPLHLGQKLEVTLDSHPGLGIIEGVVEEIPPAADPLSHSFLVKIGLPNVEIATGATGKAWLPTSPRSAVVIPQKALLHRGGLELVVILDDEGLASSRVVTTGSQRDDGSLEILSGLNGDETLLLGLTTVPAAATRVEGRS